ncbi:MAG: CBS domain-containing protein [Clostridium sp.]|nr:CBS domain-containing protein [Clostridium sp.]MCM1548174.1 CBS domain-containing protein [Ruminococcus sp.]
MNVISLLIPKANVAYLYEDCTLRQGLEKMRAHRYTAIPVLTRDGMYAGTVSEGDFLWNLIDDNDNNIRDKEKLHISDIIKDGFNPPADIYIKPDELLRRSINQTFIPLTDDRGSFMGIVTRQIIIRTFLANKENI